MTNSRKISSAYHAITETLAVTLEESSRQMLSCAFASATFAAQFLDKMRNDADLQQVRMMPVMTIFRGDEVFVSKNPDFRNIYKELLSECESAYTKYIYVQSNDKYNRVKIAQLAESLMQSAKSMRARKMQVLKGPLADIEIVMLESMQHANTIRQEIGSSVSADILDLLLSDIAAEDISMRDFENDYPHLARVKESFFALKKIADSYKIPLEMLASVSESYVNARDAYTDSVSRIAEENAALGISSVHRALTQSGIKSSKESRIWDSDSVSSAGMIALMDGVHGFCRHSGRLSTIVANQAMAVVKEGDRDTCHVIMTNPKTTRMLKTVKNEELRLREAGLNASAAEISKNTGIKEDMVRVAMSSDYLCHSSYDSMIADLGDLSPESNELAGGMWELSRSACDDLHGEMLIARASDIFKAIRKKFTGLDAHLFDEIACEAMGMESSNLPAPHELRETFDLTSSMVSSRRTKMRMKIAEEFIARGINRDAI